jgi:hypothetical protein
MQSVSVFVFIRVIYKAKIPLFQNRKLWRKLIVVLPYIFFSFTANRILADSMAVQNTDQYSPSSLDLGGATTPNSRIGVYKCS